MKYTCAKGSQAIGPSTQKAFGIKRLRDHGRVGIIRRGKSRSTQPDVRGDFGYWEWQRCSASLSVPARTSWAHCCNAISLVEVIAGASVQVFKHMLVRHCAKAGGRRHAKGVFVWDESILYLQGQFLSHRNYRSWVCSFLRHTTRPTRRWRVAAGRLVTSVHWYGTHYRGSACGDWSFLTHDIASRLRILCVAALPPFVQSLIGGA